MKNWNLNNADELRSLLGWTVVGVVQTPPSSDPYDEEMLGLIFRNGKKGKALKEKVAWIQQDPEGNGGGFLLIEDA